MKVLMLGRLGLLSGSGGDKVQILNTASELRKLGVTVDVKDSFNFNPQNYDLVHLFQLDWTPESNMYARKVKTSGKPLVFSPIHHNVAELKKFDDEYVFDFRRVSKILFKDQFKRDTFKDFYRMVFDWRRIKPVGESLIHGLKNLHIETLRNADLVLVQTNIEADDLKETFGVDFKWKKIPNGVGDQFINVESYVNQINITNYIICVGRIEPRKNQLRIIEAVKKLRAEREEKPGLVFIGKKNMMRHFEYTLYFDVQTRNNEWIKHIESVPYAEIPSYYHYAKVGVSASWFETTGLTSLEALFCGTNAVASGKRAMEYLGKYASYCDPDSIESIYQAIKKEYDATRPVLDENMKRSYTWKNAALQTFKSYEEVLKND